MTVPQTHRHSSVVPRQGLAPGHWPGGQSWLSMEGKEIQGFWGTPSPERPWLLQEPLPWQLLTQSSKQESLSLPGFGP